ncbi:MAG: GNAT family N-acetyltransferase [Oscillospiraceae bacterium]|jgi:GNAT superfamily N-acetyltransferase|nr:GNAT family N-acetyltransferase [Oscillospiraceae bacterium]
MELRKATLDDVRALVALRKRQLADEGMSPSGDIDAALGAFFNNGLTDGSYISWLAVDKHVVIATGGVCFHQLPPSFSNPSGQMAYITNMFTAGEYRRRGIASLLLEKVLDEARSRGVTVARLHASADGKNLYARFGFEKYEDYMTLNL